MHLLVEAADEKSLARGMNGLGVRVAKGLNRVMGRHGKVLDERYHGHILRTPTEVRHARAYLSTNAERHLGVKGADPYASRHPLVQPETFLMRRIC
jgi:hypothetical protein